MSQATLSFAVQRNADPASAAQRQAILADPGFGRYCTDHMVSLLYTHDRGWYDAAVLPYGPIQLDPSAIVLHYAQEIFEGLKAYRWTDGSIVSFRPEANAARLRSSARRLAIPELPDELFIESLRQLIAIDHEWVPGEDLENEIVESGRSHGAEGVVIAHHNPSDAIPDPTAFDDAIRDELGVPLDVISLE